MVFQIRAGQAKLQKKAEEFQEKRDGKKLLGSLGELQELFISHSVLVQHALLIEESIVNSVWNKLMGFCTFLWIIVTLWGTVLVLTLFLLATPGYTNWGCVALQKRGCANASCAPGACPKFCKTQCPGIQAKDRKLN